MTPTPNKGFNRWFSMRYRLAAAVFILSLSFPNTFELHLHPS